MMVMSSMRKCIGQIAATLVVAAACAGAAGQCPVRFASWYPTYFNPLAQRFVVADFDQDGWPDLAIAGSNGSGPGAVQVTRNTRSASAVYFLPVELQSVGSDPSAITSGDVDGDGLADLVTASRLSSDASVLFGNGDGSFQAEVPRRVGFQPSSIALADLNADGRDDLVSTDWQDQTISVILSLPGRQFSARTTFGVGWAPVSTSFGDANGDGHIDILVVNELSDDVSVLLGNGNGTFAPERFFRFGQDNGNAILVDLDDDGRSEVVMLYTSNDTSARRLGVFSVTNAGLFELVSFIDISPFIIGPMVSGDFDGDGDQDVNVSGRLFAGFGNRTLQLIPLPTFGGEGTGLQCVDVNADGRSDFVRLGAAVNAFLNTSFPVTQQPQSTVACPIRSATFSAAANGTPPYTYRWQYRPSVLDATIPWVNLVPGTNAVAGPTGPLEFNAAGTDTGTLTVDREALLGWPASTLIGSFRCIIGSACGDVITQEAVMTTSDRCSCYDFNSDENVDLLDAQQMAQVFVGLITPQPDWLSGDLNADENADLSDAQALAVFVVTGTCGV